MLTDSGMKSSNPEAYNSTQASTQADTPTEEGKSLNNDLLVSQVEETNRI